MALTILYTLGSVAIVSMVSLVSLYALGIKEDVLKKFLTYMVSFSTGALFADAFIHLLPETVKESGSFTLFGSASVLLGILFSFVVEKGIHWRHCHHPEHINHTVHPFALMNLFGDSIHNFIDGLIIGASYLVSIPVGIATTLAVIFHEIPQEIGDFGVLLHGGFTKTRALFYNFLTALTAVVGGIIALIIGTRTEHLTSFLIPFAAGSFIYIAGSDLIPELHKEVSLKKSIAQFVVMLCGVLIIASLLLLE